MPSFQLDVPHELGQAQAIRRLEYFVDGVKKKNSAMVTEATTTWTENVMTFVIKSMAGSMDGKITIEEKRAVVDCNLPLAAMMFQGMIKQQFKDDLTKLLNMGQ